MANVSRLYEPYFTQELYNYGKEHKAEYVYHHCIRRQHFLLAQKIVDKYGPFVREQGSDKVMAFGLALGAANRLRKY